MNWAGFHFIPLHMHPYYHDTYGYAPDDFPVARGIFERCLSLPIYPGMLGENTERVVAAVRSRV